MPGFLPRLVYSFAAPHILERFREQCKNPGRAQEELLAHILERNQNTAFGQAHRFSELFTFAEYKAAVPITEYETLEPYIRKAMEGEAAQLTAEKPLLYGVTSGTTGPAKYIPVTLESKQAKARLMKVWLAGLFSHHPGIFNGRILVSVSPEEESKAPDGTPCGAESGHGYKNIPWFIKSCYSVPYEVYKIKDYHARYYALLRTSVEHSISLIYCCNPSTVLLLGELMEEYSESIVEDIRSGTLREDLTIEAEIRQLLLRRYRPNPQRAKELEHALEAEGGKLRPRSVWPQLTAIACWTGGTVGMYLDKFDRYFPQDVSVRDIGYLATELRGSVPLLDDDESGVLAIQTNVYEFAPAAAGEDVDPSTLLRVEDLKAGERYLLYVTTSSGLYRYNMHDILEVTGFFENTPLVKFLQKGKGFVSFTGEKLSEAQVLSAAEGAFSEGGMDGHFIAAVGEPAGEGLPRYSFLVEFDRLPSREKAIAWITRLEELLRELNVEYAGKRDSLRLGPPRLCCVARGGFNEFRKREVNKGKADGQFKIIRLTDKTDFLKEFTTELEVSLEEHAAGSDAKRPAEKRANSQ